MTDTTKVKEAEMYQELQSIYLKYNQRKRPLSGQIYETITLIDKYTIEARLEMVDRILGPNDKGEYTYIDIPAGQVEDWHDELIIELTEQKDGE